jgi:type II secretory pathway component PulF
MANANIFPSMVLQMCAIGEESGSIDHMLGKAPTSMRARSTKWWRACPA